MTDDMIVPELRREARHGATLVPLEFARISPDKLVHVGPADPAELVSMRLFAFAVPTRTFALVPAFDRLSTPAFDGVVLDVDRHPIANFSLKTLTSEKIEEIGDQALRRMERYGTPEKWAEFLRKSVMHRTTEEAPPEIVLATPEREEVFERAFERVRNMVRLLAPGSGRPDWLLLDLTALPELSRERVQEVSEHLTAGKHQRFVLILNADRLYTLHDGGLIVEPAPPAKEAWKCSHF